MSLGTFSLDRNIRRRGLRKTQHLAGYKPRVIGYQAPVHTCMYLTWLLRYRLKPALGHSFASNKKSGIIIFN